jgi:hypothetical protein
MPKRPASYRTGTGGRLAAWERVRRRLLAGFAVLALSFCFNAFGAATVYEFKGFQADSERLVLNAFECQNLHGPGTNHGLLLMDTSRGCEKAGPYFPQSGTPFRLLGLGYPSRAGLQAVYVQLLRLCLALTSALLLAMIIHRAAIGLRAGYYLLAVALAALSPWLVVFSVNLFWLLPLLLLPGWFGWVYFPRLRDRQRLFFGILGGLFLLKFLAGYEYASTLAISAAVPVAWHELRMGTAYRSVIRRSLLCIAAAIVGFTFALGINFVQASAHMGSPRAGWRILYDRAKTRSFAYEDPDLGQGIVRQLEHLKPDDYEYFENLLHLTRHEGSGRRDKLWQNAVVAYQYAAASAYSPPLMLRFPFTVLLSSVATFAGIAIAVAFRRFRTFGRNFAYRDPLAFVSVAALLGGFSWLVLGYQHSFIHTHINPIIFYLPFLPLAYVLTARIIQDRMDSKTLLATDKDAGGQTVRARVPAAQNSAKPTAARPSRRKAGRVR